jgi:hypothetical protein
MRQTGSRSSTEAEAPAQQWQAEWLMGRPNAATKERQTLATLPHFGFLQSQKNTNVHERHCLIVLTYSYNASEGKFGDDLGSDRKTSGVQNRTYEDSDTIVAFDSDTKDRQTVEGHRRKKKKLNRPVDPKLRQALTESSKHSHAFSIFLIKR